MTSRLSGPKGDFEGRGAATDGLSALLTQAREQSAELAERRASTMPLPEVPQRRTTPLHLRFAVSGLALAVVAAAGVSWAVIDGRGRGPAPGLTPAVAPAWPSSRVVQPLGGGSAAGSDDAVARLLRRAETLGPAPVRRLAARVGKAQPVVERSVVARRRAVAKARTRRTKSKTASAIAAKGTAKKAAADANKAKAVAKANAGKKQKVAAAASKRTVVRFDEPQRQSGAVIIVHPRAKMGPLWTKKSFEKLIRSRMLK